MSNTLARLREAEVHRLRKHRVRAKGSRVKVKYSLTGKDREITNKLLKSERLAKLFLKCRNLKRGLAE